jgi:spermidine synthase
MHARTRATLFFLFFASGFCALLYQTVWTRLAFASFGIIAPVLSVVLSIFMLGLAGGAWIGGRVISPLQKRTGWSPLVFYAATEFVIGLGAFVVPDLFRLSKQILLAAGQMDSARYLFFSALALGLSILPWCLCMGATFPFMMAFVRERRARNEESFSFLYLANVLGAMTGTAVTAIVLIETLGFRHTLYVAGFANFLVAAISCILAWTNRTASAAGDSSLQSAPASPRPPALAISENKLLKLILFSTGFCAMAMEVVWVRSFTPILETQVYAFASILFTYLGATFLGSVLYRRDLARDRVRSVASLTAVCAIAAFLPIVVNDARLLSPHSPSFNRIAASLLLLASISPLCAALGYLTPGLIDRGGRGEPVIAGKLYAVNVIGCILGPLIVSYLLLPSLGERYTLVLLALPFLLFFPAVSKEWVIRYRAVVFATATTLLVWSTFFVLDFAGFISRDGPTEIRRDYAASVIATGEGQFKHLLVNGVGMTGLIPTTKFMIHLPLMLHTGPAESALIICFGMGTTFRSALSWNIDTTAVELVRSVPESFAFYHADAAEVLRNPKGRIVIDDGRRYLERTREKYDVIVIDPPPPVPAAGSSLLYSEEFYTAAKRNLKSYGILQAWLPVAEPATEQAVIRSVSNSFPYVHCFRSPGDVGTHILASMEPIGIFSPVAIANSMPLTAASDLLEWSGQGWNLNSYVAWILEKPITLEQALNPNPRLRITDDQPYNEYFIMRQWGLLQDRQ